MNTRKLWVVGLLALAVLLLSAFRTVRGSGNLITEARNVSNFERVDLGGSGAVIITQGEEESLTVQTDDNVMQYVTTNVRGRTLHLGMDTRQLNFASPTRLRFMLQVKDLSGLDVSGSGSIEAATLTTDRLAINISGSGSSQIGVLATDQLNVDISGSGSTQIDELTADQLNVETSGSSNIQIIGDVTRANIDISGSGNVRMGDLRCDVVDVRVSGSGAATVWAIESLDVDLSGSGSVRYYGSPSVDSSTSGSGMVTSMGGK